MDNFTAILPLLELFRVTLLIESAMSILPAAVRIHIMSNPAYGSINLIRLPTMPQVESSSDGLIHSSFDFWHQCRTFAVQQISGVLTSLSFWQKECLSS